MPCRPQPGALVEAVRRPARRRDDARAPGCGRPGAARVRAAARARRARRAAGPRTTAARPSWRSENEPGRASAVVTTTRSPARPMSAASSLRSSASRRQPPQHHARDAARPRRRAEPAAGRRGERRRRAEHREQRSTAVRPHRVREAESRPRPRGARSARAGAALTGRPVPAAGRAAPGRCRGSRRARRPSGTRRARCGTATIFCAVTGPTPGSASSCSAVAALSETGRPAARRRRARGARPQPPAAAHAGTSTCCPSETGAARFTPSRSALRVKPPARATASATREPAGSRTRPGTANGAGDVDDDQRRTAPPGAPPEPGAPPRTGAHLQAGAPPEPPRAVPNATTTATSTTTAATRTRRGAEGAERATPTSCRGKRHAWETQSSRCVTIARRSELRRRC